MKQVRLTTFFMINILCATMYAAPPETAPQYDVVIYGGTSAGVVAAVQAARMNKRVVLIEPTTHVGGLSAAGLGFTDTGDKRVIGGLGREFYHRIWKHYQSDEAWIWQTREAYGNQGQGTPAIDGANRTMWISRCWPGARRASWAPTSRTW